jgi:hypothetical protein
MRASSFLTSIADKALLGATLFLMMGAASEPRFPKELQGTWDLGPASCKLPVSPDSDTPIRIDASRLAGYENVDTPVRITRVSKEPAVWVIASESSVSPGMVVKEVFVLMDDYLTITTGETARSYRRCR